MDDSARQVKEGPPEWSVAMVRAHRLRADETIRARQAAPASRYGAPRDAGFSRHRGTGTTAWGGTRRHRQKSSRSGGERADPRGISIPRWTHSPRPRPGQAVAAPREPPARGGSAGVLSPPNFNGGEAPCRKRPAWIPAKRCMMKCALWRKARLQRSCRVSRRGELMSFNTPSADPARIDALLRRALCLGLRAQMARAEVATHVFWSSCCAAALDGLALAAPPVGDPRL